MEEEEFDPAFMNDEDLGGAAGSLGELGGMFGGESLGGQGDFSHDSGFGGSSPTEGSSLAGSLAELDGMGTPLRRSRGAGGAASNPNRLSLAFELASATPGRGNRDLMRELGIEEDEDGEEEDEEEEDPEGGQDEDLERTPSHRTRYSTTTGDDHLDEVHSSPSTPLRRSKGYSSSASLSSSFHADSSETSYGTSSPANQEELDASFLEATTALGSSLETTGVFLSHLRQHTNVEVDPHAAPAPSPAKSALSASSASADPFSLSPSNRIPVDYTDRQPLLESTASSYLKTMNELSKQREEQVKELGEMERLVSKNEVAWKATLAALDDEEDSLSPQGGEADASCEEPTTPVQSAHQHFSEGVFGRPNATPTRRMPSSSASASFPSSARVELSNLRDVTSSLISALSAINEVTQVNQAATGEAGRKLRALRNHLVTVKEDLSSYERSEEYIQEYEAKEARNGGRKKGRFAEMVREEMRGAEKALEEGWTRAQQVLAQA